MKKRQWAILGGAAILVIAFIVKNQLASNTIDEKPSRSLPVKGVEVMVINQQDLPVKVHMDGKLSAVNKIELYSEVNGVLQARNKKFQEGTQYRKGEILLSIENSEAKAAYLSAQSEYINVVTQALPDLQLDYPEVYSTWQSYLDAASKNGRIPPPPSTSNDQLRLFLTGRGVYSSYQNMESIRIRLSKYQLAAPFDGVVTESSLDPGTLVRVGQRLGEYIAPVDYELASTISTTELDLVKRGDRVVLTSPDSEGQWIGEIFRINAKVDPATQRVKVYVHVQGEDLKDGMFMNASIEGRVLESAFSLARKLIYDSHYTYVVENDSILKRAKIDIILSNPGTVIARGLPNGSLVPNEPITGAFSGMKVKVVRSMQSSDGKTE